MSKDKYLQNGLVIVLVMSIIVIACKKGEDISTNPTDVQNKEKWVSDIPFYYNSLSDSLPHDNRIYESSNFLTFSDGSSDEVKKQYSGMAEGSLAELMMDFDIPNSAALGIVDQSSKITIYSNQHSPYRQQAFRYGFILLALDHEYTLTHETFRDKYRNMVKHETMHLIQFYLTGESPPGCWVEFWFQEGIAEYMCGSVQDPITSWEEVEQWRNEPDHVNPISIHWFEDFPDSITELDTVGPTRSTRVGEYYPMFSLAVHYLLEPAGYGKTLEEVKAIFSDMKGGQWFVITFEENMGLSLYTFESEFYDRIYNYFQNIDQ